MLLRFLRTNGAQIIIFIPFIATILWIGIILNPGESHLLSDTVKMPAFSSIDSVFIHIPFLANIFSLALTVSVAFLLVRLNTRFILINNRTYLPALLYILLIAGIPPVQKFNPAIVSGFVVLFMIEKILESYRNNSLFYGFFTAAFVIGCGSLIYPYLAFFILTLWGGLILLRPFIWREWFFTILGFLTPYFFAFSYFYIFFNDPRAIYDQLFPFFTAPHNSSWHKSPILVYFLVSLFIILVSSQYIFQTYASRKIISRRAYSLFFILFANTLLVFLLIGQASVELIYIMAIPIAFLMANFWVFIRSMFWGNLLLLLFIGSIIFSQLAWFVF